MRQKPTVVADRGSLRNEISENLQVRFTSYRSCPCKRPAPTGIEIDQQTTCLLVHHFFFFRLGMIIDQTLEFLCEFLDFILGRFHLIF